MVGDRRSCISGGRFSIHRRCRIFSLMKNFFDGNFREGCE